MEKTLASLEALEHEAAGFVQGISPASAGATLVTLSGELGAGKTAYVKAAAKALGVEDHVTSPTFVLEKIYALSTGPFSKLVHIDAYRLKSGSELHALGFGELMGDSKNLVMLEWPEQVSDLLPKPSVAITLVPNADGSRQLTYV